MDFKSLKRKQLRSSLYIEFANTNSLQLLYSKVITAFKTYLEENLLPQNYDQDILYVILKENKFDSKIRKMHKVEVKIFIHSIPLFPAINIANDLKQFSQVVTKMNKIGYQHLHILDDAPESSESSGTYSSDSDSDQEDNFPLRDKLKNYREKMDMECSQVLTYHRKNYTQIYGSKLHVDILIWVEKKVCKELAKYLGLIYLEDLLGEIEENDMNNVLMRLYNKNTILYKVTQSYINKKLIQGYNNICLVHTLRLWENINCNVKAAIINRNNKPLFLQLTNTANIHLELGKNPFIFDYIEAVTCVIDFSLGCETHLIAKYQFRENSYVNVKLPLISIVPLYVLRYFTHCELRERSNKLI